jgi:hypothetical protein
MRKQHLMTYDNTKYFINFSTFMQRFADFFHLYNILKSKTMTQSGYPYLYAFRRMLTQYFW